MQVAPDQVSSVRLILRQPSSVWRSFSLEDIRIQPRSRSVWGGLWGSAGVCGVCGGLRGLWGSAGAVLTSAPPSCFFVQLIDHCFSS